MPSSPLVALNSSQSGPGLPGTDRSQIRSQQDVWTQPQPACTPSRPHHHLLSIGSNASQSLKTKVLGPGLPKTTTRSLVNHTGAPVLHLFCVRGSVLIQFNSQNSNEITQLWANPRASRTPQRPSPGLEETGATRDVPGAPHCRGGVELTVCQGRSALPVTSSSDAGQAPLTRAWREQWPWEKRNGTRVRGERQPILCPFVPFECLPVTKHTQQSQSMEQTITIK